MSKPTISERMSHFAREIVRALEMPVVEGGNRPTAIFSDLAFAATIINTAMSEIVAAEIAIATKATHQPSAN